MVQRRTLLGIYAHPDDEVLGVGGTLARYAAEGVEVVLVVATRGEAGEIQNPGTATPETLPQVREQEMLCSANALGISDVLFLGYRDSGMAGTPENDDPRALVNAPAKEVVNRLAAIIRRVQPQVVLTFEPYGGYGHPDHIAINRHTIAAIEAAEDAGKDGELGQPWQVDRLFYHILPAALFQEIKRRVAAHGGDVSGYDESIEGRNEQLAWSDDTITVVLDNSKYIDRKWEAWHCHRTQFGPDSRFRRLPEDEMKEVLSKEYFALARPLLPDRPQLKDLFDGLE